MVLANANEVDKYEMGLRNSLIGSSGNLRREKKRGFNYASAIASEEILQLRGFSAGGKIEPPMTQAPEGGRASDDRFFAKYRGLVTVGLRVFLGLG